MTPRTADAFSVRLDVRMSDVDPQLHVTGSAYQQYADHARFACVEAAGVSVQALLADGLGPVNLETTIRYLSELRAGDQVDVTCTWEWGEGKTYRVHHVLSRPDGTKAAEITHVSGLLDLTGRRLISDPATQWGRRATEPSLLNLH